MIGIHPSSEQSRNKTELTRARYLFLSVETAWNERGHSREGLWYTRQTCFRIPITAHGSPYVSRRSEKWCSIILNLSSKEGMNGSESLERKTQGFPRTPLPIITPSHPVSSIILFARRDVVTSPFPITGIRTAPFTFSMSPQSARPENP